MGQPKALLQLGSLTFLGHIVKNHRSLGLPVTVILGEHQAQIQAAVDLSDSVVLINPLPERGPLSSVRMGLQTCDRRQAALVHPVDHPLVLTNTLEAIVDAHRRMPYHIVVPEFGSRRGHPVLFPQLFFQDLLATPLDQGARYVVRKHAESVLAVRVSDEGVTQNIDTPEEYNRLVRPTMPD